MKCLHEVINSLGGKSHQIKCFKCLDVGHMASQCLNRRVMAVLETISKEEREELDEPEDLSVILDEYYGDADAEVQGDGRDDQFVAINVLHKTLTTNPSIEEEQRENLFHIAYRVKGNYCALIIDGNSYTNVVPTSLVEKLKSATIPHPKPYKLH